ncbi:S26 family signal peptidase [Mycolicibacterium sp.]|uniref:S26 family signal peptidase n=1 Tax=Mycolicibacterium sp. TaxID=2320850 RepID=UPI003D13C66C
MSGNQRWWLSLRRRWPVRRFVVVEDSMRPGLVPGDGLLAMRGGTPKVGQLRVFRDPRGSSRYLVKRVGAVCRSATGTTFEALSDNAAAPGVVDSRQFGWVPAADSYRVVLRVPAGR